MILFSNGLYYRHSRQSRPRPIRGQDSVHQRFHQSGFRNFSQLDPAFNATLMLPGLFFKPWSSAISRHHEVGKSKSIAGATKFWLDAPTLDCQKIHAKRRISATKSREKKHLNWKSFWLLSSCSVKTDFCWVSFFSKFFLFRDQKLLLGSGFSQRRKLATLDLMTRGALGISQQIKTGCQLTLPQCWLCQMELRGNQQDCNRPVLTLHPK